MKQAPKLADVVYYCISSVILYIFTKMRNHVFFGVLAILAIYASGAAVEPEAAEVPAEPVTVVDEVDVSPLAEGVQRSAANTRNLNVGWISTGDRLLYRGYFTKTPIVNAIQTQDVTYRGNATTRITAIQVNEVGYTQWASAYLTGGGVNNSWVSIRLSTARGYGYYFLLDIWGR